MQLVVVSETSVVILDKVSVLYMFTLFTTVLITLLYLFDSEHNPLMVDGHIAWGAVSIPKLYAH